MTRNNSCAASRAAQRKGLLPIVRSTHQFGSFPKHLDTVKLFLDDARNPPLQEKGWVVVRTVLDGIAFLEEHNDQVTTVSLDNDLGKGLEGYMLLQHILAMYNYGSLPLLKKIIIHTGNLPKWRLMEKMGRGKGLIIKRCEPEEWIYPPASRDTRFVKPWTRGGTI